jgi:hypothetical protein
MPNQRFFLNILTVAVVLVLTGCATVPSTEYDPQLNAHVTALEVKEVPSIKKPDYYVVHRVGDMFGVVGSLTSSIIVAADGDTFADSVMPYGVDFGSEFNESLSQKLTSAGYQVMPLYNPNGESQMGYLKSYPTSAPVLDIKMSVVGYSSPAGRVYDPSISVSAKLVEGSAENVLYEKTFIYAPDNSLKGATLIKSDPTHKFDGFRTMVDNPEIAIEGIRAGLDAIAVAIANDLARQ